MTFNRWPGLFMNRTTDFQSVDIRNGLKVHPTKLVDISGWAILLVILCAVGSQSLQAADDHPINPFPRQVISRRSVVTWDFKNSVDGWKAVKGAQLVVQDAALRVNTMGEDPMLMSPRFTCQGPLLVRVKMASHAPGQGQFFWIGTKQPHASEKHSTRFDVDPDGMSHEYLVSLPATNDVFQLRFDPAAGTGYVEIDRIEIEELVEHPLEFAAISANENQIECVIQNHGDVVRAGNFAGKPFSIEPNSKWNKTIAFDDVAPLQTDAAKRPYRVASLTIKSDGLPNLTRTLVVPRSDVQVDNTWKTIGAGETIVRLSPDGIGARIERSGKLVAHLAPVAMSEQIPLAFAWQTDSAGSLRAKGTSSSNVSVTLTVEGNEVKYLASSSTPIEGPVVRAIGGLEQGLLAGVEHLGRHEKSSSTLDVHGPEHLRYAPDRFLLTMPLMSFVTDVGAVAMTWSDMKRDPRYATPNFFDGTGDHRMSLVGQDIAATIRVGPSFDKGGRLEDDILWCVRKRGGLPALPETGRNSQQQLDLSLAAFERSELHAGNREWFHAIIPGGQRLPNRPHHFSDLASSLFRANGTIPDATRLSFGGGHVTNDVSFFVTGRAAEWIQHASGRASHDRSRQQADGSYRYDGRFREGHFENTSSGQCAKAAADLLEHAMWSGDESSLSAGLKTLEFMKRFRTPRGASVWECPLHAPDLLASAWAARAYLRGYQLTDRSEYRDLAVRWALSGVPYVYLWSERPIMAYATTGTLCATHYEAPVWIGRPVQWMGLVYADALLDLAEYDQTLDWRQLADGITRCGEQMQYTTGPSIGCLPDSWLVRTQTPLPFDINPSALLGLRARLSRKPAGLAIVRNGSHRYVAPFPIAIGSDGVKVKSVAGVSYQMIVDGRVVQMTGSGSDAVPDPKSGNDKTP